MAEKLNDCEQTQIVCQALAQKYPDGDHRWVVVETDGAVRWRHSGEYLSTEDFWILKESHVLARNLRTSEEATSIKRRAQNVVR